MLAWPGFAVLKHYWPESVVCALVPPYTEEMARLCPWIDEIITDQGESAKALSKRLAENQFDALLTLFSTSRVAWAGYLSHIPYRLAPATKLFQFFYNHRLTQRRSRSAKPEYAYNIDLVYQLLHDLHGEDTVVTAPVVPEDYLPACLTRPLLAFSATETAALRHQLCTEYGFETTAKLIFIHPGSGGSANNLLPSQYTALANQLQSEEPLAVIVTAGPGEEETAAEIAAGITAHPAANLRPQGGLSQLARYLQLADLFISCSTGPLHIAGALDRPTAAFYPRHRSGSPLRWQTLNAPEKRLVFTPPGHEEAKEVANIDICGAACKISERFFSL